MADFRVDVGFFGHIKTKRLRKRLGAEGVIALQMLWAYSAMHEHDGNKIYSAEDISLAVDWDDDGIAEVLADIGFLNRVDHGFTIHEWEEHNGYAASASKRTESARIAANKRWEGKRKAKKNNNLCDTQCDSNADTCDTQCDSNAPSPSPSPSPSPIERGKKRFSPPSLEEVTSYCLERKNNVDPIQWHAHYSSNGWKVGKNKMVDWKQAVITWETRSRDGTTTMNAQPQARTVRDAMTIQGEEIARALNEDNRRRQQAGPQHGQTGGVLLEH